MEGNIECYPVYSTSFEFNSVLFLISNGHTMTAAERFKDIFTEDKLEKLYLESVRYRNAKGIDNISNDSFSKDLANNVGLILRKAKNRTYHFSQYKEILLSKGKNRFPRVVSIPTLRDRLTLKALNDIIHPLFIGDYDSLHMIIASLVEEMMLTRYDSFIRMDVKNFYSSIIHDILLKSIRRKIRKREILHLISDAISQSTVEVPSKYYRDRSAVGIPQGLSISNVLANIYMLKIDNKYKNINGIKYYRFVDDILILCNTNEVNNLLYDLETKFNNLDLKIHTQNENKDKSSNGRVKDGFQYLGYSFSDRKVSVRQSSVQRIYDKINKLFISFGHKKNSKNANHASVLEDLIYSLNEKIAGAKYQDKKYGWINYFSEIDDHTLLFKLDSHVKKMSKKYLNEKDFKYLKNSGLKIKKFSKAFFEIKNINSNYIERPESNNINRLIRLLLSDQKDLKNKVGDVNNKITNKENITSKKAINKKNLNIEKPHREPELVIKSLISDVEPYQ